MIKTLRLSDLAMDLSATLKNGDAVFNHVSIDSRTIAANDLFVAIVGVNYDGHRFVSYAEKNQASALIVERDVETHLPYLLVDNTTNALGKLGKINRDAFEGKIVAITGSSGKTSVKEMLASVLNAEHNVYVTKKNQNNEIGVPLALLDLTNEYDVAILELGARKRGDIRYLVDFVCPNAALITNVSSAHLETFGSTQGIAETKGEIIDGVVPSGHVFINADDDFAEDWMNRALRYSVTQFSQKNAQADFFASNLNVDSTGCYTFTMHHHEDMIDVYLPLPGIHNVMNALAVASIASHLGVPLEKIQSGLKICGGVSGRLNVLHLSKNITLIDDTYNANPASTKAAIDVLSQADGEKWLVFGDMGELGEKSDIFHSEIGSYAKQQNVDAIFAVGEHAASAVRSFGEENSRHFSSKTSLMEAIYTKCLEQDREGYAVTLLIKASRFMHFEDIVNHLKGLKEC